MGKKSRTRKQKRKQMKLTNNKEMTKVKNYTTTTKTTWKPPCHTGQNKIFTTTTGIDVYGGGRNRNGGWWKCSPMVDLAIGPDETMRPVNKSILTGSTVVPDGWSCEKFVGGIDPPKYIIDMDFPDFGVPQVSKLFWYALCDDIVEHGIKSVSTQCAGGHGRTGVQLAILFYLLNADDVRATIADAGQLIELIRELHCDHAVETTEQQRYIADVLDIPVGEIVIEDRYSGLYGYGGGWGKASGVTTTPTATIKTTSDDDTWEDVLSEKWDIQPHPPEDDPCECCGEATLNVDDECTNCGWTGPSLEGSRLCYTCGKHHPADAFTYPDDAECMVCHSRFLGIKYDDTSVECSGCEKLRYFDFIAQRNDQDKFVCYPCVSKKEMSE